MPKISSNVSLYRERTNWRMVSGLFILALFATGLLWASAQEEWWKSHKTWQVVAQQFGSALLVPFFVTCLWEVGAKRAFLEEVLRRIKVPTAIEESGLISITKNFHHFKDWSNLINHSREIDFLFFYAGTWRNTYDADLRAIAASKKLKRMRVALPDTNSDPVCNELANRFNMTVNDVKSRIIDTETYFRSLPWSGKQLQIYRLRMAPHYTFYRFDQAYYFTPYTHTNNKAEIPVIACEEGGYMYDFFEAEGKAIFAHERRVK